MKSEQEEKEHKKEEHLCTTIKVARDEDLAEQIGKDIYFDLVDHEKVRSFHIQKQMPFNKFKEEVSEVFGIPVRCQRFWLWDERLNHTYRPNRPLTKLDEKQCVGTLRERSNPVQNSELKLFLEVERGLHLRPIVPPEKTEKDILLFFKHYNPQKEELSYVGRLFVKHTGRPIEILSRLNGMAGYDPDEEMDLYEEIMFEPSVMCEPIDKKSMFITSQLGDGDIICFQKSLSVESAEQFRYPNVPSFLESVQNHLVVHFRSLEKPKEDDFCVEMSMFDTYDNVVEKVAQQLGLDDPSKIRLTAHNCYSQRPKPQPFKYRGVNRLSDMLVQFNKSSDILYYEVLDVPLPELQYFETLKVASHHAIKDEESLKKEHEEKELKKKEAEAQLCTLIKVARDEDLGKQIGRDIYFDLVDCDKVQSFRFEKQTPFIVFKEEVAKVFGIPVQFQRFWLLAKRDNHTYRPKLPLTNLNETQPLGTLAEVSNEVQNVELKLFLEVELGLDLHPIAPPAKRKKDILLFFKHYNPEKEELRYVGRLFVKRTGKPTDILSRLNEMAGYSPDEEIDLYEEIKFEPNIMCGRIDKNVTFGASQLGDGDIICFQKSLPIESTEKFRYPDVCSFLEYVHNRQVVHFRSLENPKEDDFCLEMSKLDTYDNVVEKVAQQLGFDDPSKIRLTAHNCYSQQPKPQPIQYRGVGRLSDMLVLHNKSSRILYYEV